MLRCWCFLCLWASHGATNDLGTLLRQAHDTRWRSVSTAGTGCNAATVLGSFGSSPVSPAKVVCLLGSSTLRVAGGGCNHYEVTGTPTALRRRRCATEAYRHCALQALAPNWLMLIWRTSTWPLRQPPAMAKIDPPVTAGTSCGWRVKPRRPWITASGSVSRRLLVKQAAIPPW